MEIAEGVLVSDTVQVGRCLGALHAAGIAEGGAPRSADALAAIGCDYIQGYFYSKAVALDEFESLLERE